MDTDNLPLTLEALMRMGKAWEASCLANIPVEKRLQGEEIEEFLQGLDAETVLKHYDPEERVQGLEPEERLKGLSPEQIEAYLHKIKRH